MKKKEEGITLVALIVTIIILIILAAVTLRALMGEHGILQNAKVASEEHEESQAREVLELAMQDLIIDKKVHPEKYNEGEYINNYLKEEEMKVEGDKVTVEGWMFEIDRSVPKIAKRLGRAEGTGNGSGSGDDKPETPVSNTEKLLASVGEDGNKSLEEIVEDENLLNKILTTDESIDIIIDNKDEFLDVFINDSNVINKIANSEKMMDKIVNNSDWSNAILNNEGAIQALDNSNPRTVPNMTDFNKPEGEVFCSSYLITTVQHPPYNPFGGYRRRLGVKVRISSVYWIQI